MRKFFLLAGLTAFVSAACNATPDEPPVEAPQPLEGAANEARFLTNDLVWWNAASGDVVAWQMIGPEFTGNSEIAAQVGDTNWRLAATGDLNGDGATDFAWQHAVSGQISVWLFDAADRTNKRFTSQVIATVDPSWRLSTAGDLDGDGKADLLWRNTTSGENSVWLMNGFAFQSRPLGAVPDAGWTLRGVADLDGDGSPELLWRHANGSNVAWVMKPTARTELSTALTLTTVDPSWSLAGTADIDGDGKSDLLWRSASGQNVVWFMNRENIDSSTSLKPDVADANWRLIGHRRRTLSGFRVPVKQGSYAESRGVRDWLLLPSGESGKRSFFVGVGDRPILQTSIVTPVGVESPGFKSGDWTGADTLTKLDMRPWLDARWRVAPGGIDGNVALWQSVKDALPVDAPPLMAGPEEPFADCSLATYQGVANVPPMAIAAFSCTAAAAVGAACLVSWVTPLTGVLGLNACVAGLGATAGACAGTYQNVCGYFAGLKTQRCCMGGDTRNM